MASIFKRKVENLTCLIKGESLESKKCVKIKFLILQWKKKSKPVKWKAEDLNFVKIFFPFPMSVYVFYQ